MVVQRKDVLTDSIDLRVCVNHSATLKNIKEIPETWDAVILEWKNNV